MVDVIALIMAENSPEVSVTLPIAVINACALRIHTAWGNRCENLDQAKQKRQTRERGTIRGWGPHNNTVVPLHLQRTQRKRTRHAVRTRSTRDRTDKVRTVEIALFFLSQKQRSAYGSFSPPLTHSPHAPNFLMSVSSSLFSTPNPPRRQRGTPLSGRKWS